MVTAVDVKSGYGQKKAEPYNSIIPYLRSKQIHVEHNPEVKNTGREKKPTPPAEADKKDDLVEKLAALGKADPEKAKRFVADLQEIGALSSADHVRLASNGL